MSLNDATTRFLNHTNKQPTFFLSSLSKNFFTNDPSIIFILFSHLLSPKCPSHPKNLSALHQGSMPWKTSTGIGVLSMLAGFLLSCYSNHKDTITNAVHPAIDCYEVPRYGRLCGEQLQNTSVLVNGSRVRIIKIDDGLSFTYWSKPLDHLDMSKQILVEDTARENMEVGLKAVEKRPKMAESLKRQLVEKVAVATQEGLMKAVAKGDGVGMLISVGGGVNLTELIGGKRAVERGQHSIADIF